MNMIWTLFGVCLVSFGLVVRSMGLGPTRRNSRYSPAAVWFWLISVGVLIMLDGVILR
jgi:hypothetical protein